MYLDGEVAELDDIAFRENQPDNFDGNENCIMVNQRRGYHNLANDLDCARNASAICERPLIC